MNATAELQHPSDETLAAFVDDRLSPAERSSVIEHLDTCDSCFAQFNTASDAILAEEEEEEQEVADDDEPTVRVAPMPPRRTTFVWLGGLAAAVMVGFIVWPLASARYDMYRLVKAANAEQYRQNEGRITAPVEYRATQRLRGPGGNKLVEDHVVGVASDLVDKASQKPTVANLHRAGVALLLLKGSGDDAFQDRAKYVALAIDHLERAAQQATGTTSPAAAIDQLEDVALLTDLTAAYLTSGAEHRELALKAALRAWLLAKTEVTAWNRAKAFELNDDSAALQAWNDYLKMDDSSGWAREARLQRDYLKPPAASPNAR